MATANQVNEMIKFKEESTEILKQARFPVHKWESNVPSLESENMPNPGKILGLVWDNRSDMLTVNAPNVESDEKLTKRTILSRLGKMYDSLGIISPTMVEGKNIFRNACKEGSKWNIHRGF